MGRVLGIGLFVVVAFLAAIMAASEWGGEVVVLKTVDTVGVEHETHLWIVDDAGAQWLRAGQDGSGWLERLRTHPEVELKRGDTWGRYHATPVPGATARIHEAMAEKYGAADRLISLIRDGSKSVAVRLDPLP